MSFTNVALLCIPYELLPAVATALHFVAVDGELTEEQRQWCYEQENRLRADYDEEIKTRNLAANVPKSLKKK